MRFILSMMLGVWVAHWGYAEVENFSPELAKIILQSFERVQIPTHDEWDFSRVQKAYNAAEEAFREHAPQQDPPDYLAMHAPDVLEEYRF